VFVIFTEPVIGREPVEVTITAFTPGLEIVTDPVIGSEPVAVTCIPVPENVTFKGVVFVMLTDPVIGNDPVAVITTALFPGLEIVTDPVIGSDPVAVTCMLVPAAN
jgi:hypothetical protein